MNTYTTEEHRVRMRERFQALLLEISERQRGIVPADRPMMEAIEERIANRRAVLAAQETSNPS